MSATIGDAVALLSRVAAILAQRHRVTIADRCLYVAGARVAGVTGQEGADGVRLFVRCAVTGPNADIPKGLGRVTFVPGRRTATPEHVADAIQARLDAEAAKPVPVACPSRSREAAPALPAMPQPARVAASSVRREHDGARALYTAAARLDASFEVWREIDGERMTVLVSSNELTPGEVAALTPEMRAAYDADEARWVEVWEQIDTLAEDEDVASKRDGETAVHNGEPAPELVRECEAAAAE